VTTPSDGSPSPGADDPDAPIEELRDLGIEPSAGFVRGIYRRLNRRVLAGQLLDFSSLGWTETLVEYLKMLFGLVGPHQRPKE
jgi:hypothetical protein